MNTLTANIILLILLVATIASFSRNRYEHYNIGTLIQLTSKDIQDTHLTDDSWQYFSPEWYNKDYYYFNTKLQKSTLPYRS